MQREANLLRCSKLTCYAEFNRMVQAIARNERDGGALSGGLSALPGAQNMQGTSAEYLFYTTLSMMLRQIVSNSVSSNPTSQREDLQRVYQWFCINKPLITAKTNPKSRKPNMLMTTPHPLRHGDKSFPPTGLDRPQTAPAVLYGYQLESCSTSQRPFTSPMKQRSGKPGHNRSFTSNFMTRSLSGDLDLVGRPFDQLMDVAPSHKPTPLVGSPHPNAGQQLEPGGLQSQSKTKRSGNSKLRGRTAASPQSMAVVNFPSTNSLSGYPQRPSTVNFGALFRLAPGVAAKMELDREMHMELDDQVRYVLSRPATQPTQPHPVPQVSQGAQTDSGESAQARLAQKQELSEKSSCADRSAESTDTLMECDNPREPQDTSVQREQTAMEELEVDRSKQMQGPLMAGRSKDLTADGIDQISGTKTETLGEKREERGRMVTFKEAVPQLSNHAEPRGDSTGKDAQVGVFDSMGGGSTDEKGCNEMAVHRGEREQTGLVTKVTVSCVQRPQTVGAEVHTRHPTPQQRLSTPLSVVSISFPPTEKRPHTSEECRGVRGKPRQMRTIGAGFNRQRYRISPKRSSVANTAFCSNWQ